MTAQEIAAQVLRDWLSQRGNSREPPGLDDVARLCELAAGAALMEGGRIGLARDVLELLDKQQQYFKDRTHSLLLECKTIEQRLRADCRDIVSPPKVKPKSLFDQIEEQDHADPR